jgi:hypothetical protein
MYRQFFFPSLMAALVWATGSQEPAGPTQETTGSTALSVQTASLPKIDGRSGERDLDCIDGVCRPHDASLADPDLESKLRQWDSLADVLWEKACLAASDPSDDHRAEAVELGRKSFEWHRSASLWAAVKQTVRDDPSIDSAEALLEACRQHDRRRNGVTEARVIEQHRICAVSDRAEIVAVADLMDDYYRNANIRITVSEQLLNRLVDLSRWSADQGRDGGWGGSSIRNQVVQRLGLDLVPDPQRWSLTLIGTGKNLTRGQGTRDGASLHTIEKFDLIPKAALSGDANGSAEMRRGLADLVTLGQQTPVGSVTSASWAERIRPSQAPSGIGTPFENATRSRGRFRIQNRIDQAVEDALQRARAEWNRIVVERFVRWNLDPQPVEMRTTDDDLILRVRLAGVDQLAADTPRPALGGSLAATFQLHQSAVNNILARLDLAGRRFRLPELLEHVRQRFDPTLAEGYQPDADVEVQFAPYDPIRVQFVDGMITFEMNLCRLQFGADTSWRNVTIRTQYEVDFDGFYMTLQQTGGVRASGSRIRARDEIALGAVFDRLFSDEYCLSLMPPGYAPHFERLNVQVASLHLEDGWLSIAYRDQPEGLSLHGAAVEPPGTNVLLPVKPAVFGARFSGQRTAVRIASSDR